MILSRNGFGKQCPPGGWLSSTQVQDPASRFCSWKAEYRIGSADISTCLSTYNVGVGFPKEGRAVKPFCVACGSLYQAGLERHLCHRCVRQFVDDIFPAKWQRLSHYCSGKSPVNEVDIGGIRTANYLLPSGVDGVSTKVDFCIKSDFFN